MIIIILRIIRAGTTLVSNSFNFSWNPTIYFGFQLKLKKLLTSVVPVWVILTILIIIINPFHLKRQIVVATLSIPRY